MQIVPDGLKPEQAVALSKLINWCKQKQITQFDQQYLLRFVKARNADWPKVQKMFSEFIKWRMENEVQNIDVKDQPSFKPLRLDLIRKFYIHGYHKTDRKGRPVYIQRIGKFKIDQLFKITDQKEMAKYYIKSYQLLVNRLMSVCTKAYGSRVDKTVTILDLKGISLSHISKQVYNFIQIASTIAQNNYPECLGKMFIINSPMLFSGVWALIKGWLDKKTQDKIQIIGSSYKKALLQQIAPQNLPDFLDGGLSKEPLQMNVGPWNPDGSIDIFDLKVKQQPEQKNDIQPKILQDQKIPEHSAVKQQKILKQQQVKLTQDNELKNQNKQLQNMPEQQQKILKSVQKKLQEEKNELL